MKVIKQFGLIIIVTFIGEILKYLIPLSIPASIYGLVLMLILLMTGRVKLRDVEETSDFLIEIMPMMFVPASVGLMEAWGALSAIWVKIVIMIVATTVIVMLVTGWVTQYIYRKEQKKNDRTTTK